MTGLVEFALVRLALLLYEGQRQVLEAWAESGRRKAVLLLGRRSGKGLLAGVVMIANALMDYSAQLRVGERRYILAVANRIEQARELLRVVVELIAASPDADLKQLVDQKACTEDQVVFRNGVVIRAMPCSARTTRGLAASLVVFDEAGSYQTETEGFAAGKSLWRALTPSVAQFGSRGYLLVTSTPSWTTGLLFELWKAHELGTDPELFAIQRPTWECNPTITRESLDAEFRADAESAEVEYGATFASGGGAVLDAAAVAAAVITGRKQNPYLGPDAHYLATADPGFAAGGSEFAVAIGHVEFQIEEDDSESKIVVLDRLVGWRGEHGPLNTDMVFDSIAILLREFHIHEILSDQYSVETVTDALRKRGVDLIKQALYAELKADIFASLKRALNLGHVDLLDDPALLSQLVNLQQRPGPAGKPRIAAGTGRDDRAMVVATLVHALTTAREMTADNYPLVATVGTRLENLI